MVAQTICPKCDSKEFTETGFGLTRGRQIGITTGLVKKVSPSVYVCLNCGFVEMWISSSEDLKDVREYYRQSGLLSEAPKVATG